MYLLLLCNIDSFWEIQKYPESA